MQSMNDAQRIYNTLSSIQHQAPLPTMFITVYYYNY